MPTYDRPIRPPPKIRTPLPHVDGRESSFGDPVHAARLLEYFRLEEADTELVTSGIHAVHSYPGRLHPLWARRCLRSLHPEASVIDPFCGGGTVLVEARMAGLDARGSDINPIAARLSRLRVLPPPTADLIIAAANTCVEQSQDRRKTPFSALAGGEKDFPPHVLACLIALRDEIAKVTDRLVREVLLFSLSPLLDKFSARSDRDAPRVAVETVRKHFVERAERWIAYFEHMRHYRYADAQRADARWLPWQPASATALVSSPPYPGVYDYMAAQERRARWLGDPADIVADTTEREIGRRGSFGDWTAAMRESLSQACRVLIPGSPVYLVVGDGVANGVAVRAEQAIIEAARKLPLEFVACASQERPHFHGATARAFDAAPRREHLMLLRTVAWQPRR